MECGVKSLSESIYGNSWENTTHATWTRLAFREWKTMLLSRKKKTRKKWGAR